MIVEVFVTRVMDFTSGSLRGERKVLLVMWTEGWLGKRKSDEGVTGEEVRDGCNVSGSFEGRAGTRSRFS